MTALIKVAEQAPALTAATDLKSAIDHELATVQEMNSFALRPMIATFDEAKRQYRKLKDRLPDFNTIEDLEHRLEVGLQPADKQVIGRELMMMVGAFPHSGNADRKVYGAMLAREVEASRPSRLALESTCTRVRRTFKWTPAIAEFLEVLELEEDRWRLRAHDLANLADRFMDARRYALDILEGRAAVFAPGAEIEDPDDLPF